MTAGPTGSPTVLVVGLDDALLAGTPGMQVTTVTAADDVHARHARTGEQQGETSRTEDDDVAALVVGAQDHHGLRRLQAWHRRHPGAGAVVVVPPGDPGGVRRALVYTPGVPADTLVLESTDPALGEAVRACASRGARSRRHREVLRALAERPQSPAPSFVPAADALAAVLDRAPLGVLTLDDDARLASWNPRAAEILGLSGHDVGTPLGDVVAGPDAAGEIAAAAASRTEAFSHAVTCSAARRPELSVEINAVGTDLADGRRGILLLLLDVSVQRAAEVARDELYDRLRVVRRSQEFLLRAADVLAQADDYAATLEQLAAVAVPTLGDMCLIDILEEGRFRRMAARHADPARQDLVDVLRSRYVPSPSSQHPAAVAVRDRRTQWAFEVDQAWLESQAQDARHVEVIRRLGFTGWISVPLVAGGVVLGVVTLVSCSAARQFGPDDVVLADELAGRVAQVVAKARRYDREHEIAVALQRSMLTALPDLAPLEVAARYLPARADTQVGGDWYDVFVQPGAPPVVVIGDVVGHDLSAAAVMGQVRSTMRALAWGRSDRPAEVLAAFDELNAGMRITDFATVLYGVLEPHPPGADGSTRGARFRWSSAGHLPPLVIDADGVARFLASPPGIILGLPSVVGRPRVDHAAELAAGATLLLYTDGLVERRGEPLGRGLEALRTAAERLHGESLETFCDDVLAERGCAGDDDVALLAVRLP